MDIFMARQPIYNNAKRVYAYELLYREDTKNAFSGDLDGNKATSNLVSDAIAVFGLDNITNGNKAFINFTKELILEDFPLLLDPYTVVIEVLEDTVIDEEVIEKLKMLKSKGYTVALDDYIGDPSFEPIMQYIDIIKVDFLLVDEDTLREISQRFRGRKELLAEKIENEEEFKKAIGYGFEYFQGYYFSRPKIIKGKTIRLNAMSYGEIITELGRLSPDFDSLTKVIERDATLTYKLLQHANTMRFIQKERVTSVIMALVNMGIDEVRRWILLMLAKEFKQDKEIERVKMSYIRAIFLEKLAEKSDLSNRINEVFLMGVLSMLDAISGASIDDLVEQIPIAEDIKLALKREEENSFSSLLDFVTAYEDGDWDEIEENIEKYNFDKDSIAQIYLKCVINAEDVFSK